jgi:FkbH-like protein
MTEPLSRQALLETKSRWRTYHDSSEYDVSSPRRLRVGVASTFTAEPLVPFLGTYLLDRDSVPMISVAPYNQVYQSCIDHVTAFGGDEPDAICLLWRIEEVLGKEFSDWLDDRNVGFDAARNSLDELAGAVSTLRVKFAGSIVVSIPPYPMAIESSAMDLNNPFSVGSFHRNVVSYWSDLVADLDGVHVVDMDALQRHFGLERSVDWRKWYLYKQPYAEAFAAFLAQQLGRVLAAIYNPPKKCIALDCDNTLWGGIVGEDGLSGIALGDEFPGSAFVDFQKLLLHWKNQGVLLSLLSKNNEEDVWRVFSDHDSMCLSKSDIAAWRINWEPKASNIVDLAEDLNIGLDSIVFVDDSAFEIEQMAQACPEVRCVLTPEEPADIVETLRNHHLFDKFGVTEEDLSRTAMMASDRERKPLQESLSPEDFVKRLELKVDLFSPTEEHIGRVAQLINKTNQFNLTTIRRTEDEVQTLVESDSHRVFATKVQDRFGDYGLTGVAIFAVNGDRWDLDTFLLSCRVLGRQVERAVMATLVQYAAEHGAAEIVARYIPSPKNAPVRDLLPSHGFDVQQSGEWRLDVVDAPAQPDHVEVHFHVHG